MLLNLRILKYMVPRYQMFHSSLASIWNLHHTITVTAVDHSVWSVCPGIFLTAPSVQSVPALWTALWQRCVTRSPASVRVVLTSTAWPVKCVLKVTGNPLCQDAAPPATVTPPGPTATHVTRYHLWPQRVIEHLTKIPVQMKFNIKSIQLWKRFP